MSWEAEFIQFLQGGSSKFIDALMTALTYFGDELFFLIFACVLFWCVSKRVAFRFANIYLIGSAAIEGLKLIFARPRPFKRYPHMVQSIGTQTHGYSFPSGHTNSIASLSTLSYMQMRNTKYKNKVLILGITLTAIVMFTRMYLAQHYLTDVIAGLIVGVGLTVGLSYLYEKLKDRDKFIFVAVVPVCLISLIVVFASDLTASSGNTVKLLAGYSAFTLGYYIEQRFIKLDVKSNRLYKQILKLVIGFSVLLAIKEGFKLFMPEDSPFLYDFVRYFLMAAWASCASMYLFKLLRL